MLPQRPDAVAREATVAATNVVVLDALVPVCGGLVVDRPGENIDTGERAAILNAFWRSMDEFAVVKARET